MAFKQELINKGCIPLGWSGSGSVIQDLTGSWCIKRADESILVMDSSVSSMHHDPDRSWNTDPDPDHPKEHSLNQDNILSRLAKSDGNIRIVIATIAYEMRVYSQGVKVIIHYGSLKNIEAYHYKNGREGMAEKEVTHLTCGSLWISCWCIVLTIRKVHATLCRGRVYFCILMQI